MKRSLRISALVLAAGMAVLPGCATKAPIPLAENFDLTVQPKVRSAGHWELLSNDVVTQTLASLKSAQVPANTPMVVGLPANPSQFDRGFREFLITKLVQSGQTVYMQPDQAAAVAWQTQACAATPACRDQDVLEVTYQTQVVRHDSPRPHFVPGQFTVLAAGLMAAYGLRLEHLDAKLFATLGLAAAADYGASVYTGGPTNTELILTTTVSNRGRFLSRKTDVYYLENVDAPLFLRSAPGYKAVNLKVVS